VPAQIVQISTNRIAQIVKMGPRALHWGPTQITSHPTWRSTWQKFGAKTLGLSTRNRPRFSLAPITQLGPK
jgi:hypothetical protein